MTAIELAKIHTSFSCQLQVSAAMVSQFLDADIFRKFHRCPWASMGH